MGSRSDEARAQDGWTFMTESTIDGCSPASPPVQISARSASTGSLVQGCGCVKRSVPHMKRKPSKSDSIRNFRSRSNSFKLRSSDKSSGRARPSSSCHQHQYQVPDQNSGVLKSGMERQHPNYSRSSSSMAGIPRPRNQIPRTPMEGLNVPSIRGLGLGIVEGSTDRQVQEYILTCQKYRDLAYEAKANDQSTRDRDPSQGEASKSTKDSRQSKQNATHIAVYRQTGRAESAIQKENQTPNEAKHDSNLDESSDEELNQSSCRPN
ncbi:hypothetical protein B0J14DRAFT_560128 [Halenospora varia]|nr:hypothetical protein B0J14DRAFT_560128 [Halenospora varia]